MSLPTYDDESWLRAELPGLLEHEPSMPTGSVTDDVRRGQARLRSVRRRRTATVAIAAVLVAIAVPVGLLVRPTTDAVGPSDGGGAPAVPGVSQAWLDGISPALAAQTGWVVDWPDSTVYGDVTTGLQLDLAIVPGTQLPGEPLRFAVPSPPYADSASLRIWFAPTGKAPGAAMAECPADRCAYDLPDRKFPTYLDQSVTAGNGVSLPAGTLILDRAYDAGRFVELVAVPAVSTPASPSDQLSRNPLTYGLAAPFLDAIGAPVATPTPSTTPSAWRPSPDPSYKDGVAFVPEGEVGTAIAALLPGEVTEIAPARPASSLGVIRGFRVVRDGVGTYVRVLAISYGGGSTPDLAPPASEDPCGASTASCVVLRPWSRASSNAGTGAAAGVWSVFERQGAGSSVPTGYAGPFSIRTVVLQRGSTELVIDSDSRDVDASGTWTSSSAPGLSTDELLALAAKVPLPIRYSALAEAPWNVSGSASASASG